MRTALIVDFVLLTTTKYFVIDFDLFSCLLIWLYCTSQSNNVRGKCLLLTLRYRDLYQCVGRLSTQFTDWRSLVVSWIHSVVCYLMWCGKWLNHITDMWYELSQYLLLTYRFESKLPEVFKDIHEAYEQIDARLKAEQFKVCVNDLICCNVNNWIKQWC